ncbi:hypothetical protein Bca4012_009833 [Brassica carinata]
MRNKLIFEQQREHIVQVIHAALRDYKQWCEAIELDTEGHLNPTNLTSNSKEKHTEMPSVPSQYCLVDVSWKDSLECGGIGWSLFSKKGIQQIKGSSMIEPTNSSLEAEATALLMAVQQMRRFNYKHVTFMSDCKILIDELHQQQAEQTIKVRCITEAASMIHDIKEISKTMGFMFQYVSRNILSNVDVMAKLARVNRTNYVISWCY